MNMFTFSKNPVKKVGLVLDIGSKTVGGALFEKDAADNVKLLYTARESIAFQKILTGENLLQAMLRSLGLVLIHLEKYGLEHLNHDSKLNRQVDTIEAIVSSPWHISETKTLKLWQDKPFLVTEALVGELLAKEEADFIKGLSGKARREPNLDVLEHKIVEMQLNGYPTAAPYGKKARQLELRIFTSVAQKQIPEKIRALILRHFPVEHPEFHTFSLTAFASIRDFFPNIEHFLVVQVGGEVTDITIVKKNILTETVSFPLGHNTLLRALEKICDNHPQCTLEALLALHREAKATAADKNKVERAIEDTKISWLGLFNNAISNFSSETFLPQTVFLFEDSPYSALFEEFLKLAESSQFTITAKPFTVKTVNEFGAVFTKFGQPLSADVLLAMEANFASRF